MINSKTSPLGDQTIDFVNSVNTKKVADGWADFFTNPDEASCGAVSSCTIKHPGCGAAYTTGNLVMSSTVVGRVWAKQNTDLGWTDTVCIVCQNADGSKVYNDNWKVYQKPDCMTLTTNTLTEKIYAYSSTATNTAVYTYSDVFTNSKSTLCPVTTCTLKQSDCTTSLSVSQAAVFSIGSNSPWTLRLSQTVVQGYAT